MVDNSTQKYLSYFNALANENRQTSDDWVLFFKKLYLLKQKIFNVYQQKDCLLLKKAYFDILTQAVSQYKMPQQAIQASLNRTKILWDNLKRDKQFEKALYQYRFGNDTHKKAALSKLILSVQKAIQPIFPMLKLKAVFYDSQTCENVIPPVSFIIFDQPDKIFINVDKKNLHEYTAGHYLDNIYHELTHLLQLNSLKSRHKNPALFDDDFLKTVDASISVYETSGTLLNLNNELKNNGLLEQIEVEKINSAYMNNPMEKEAYLCDGALRELVHNYMCERGLFAHESDYDYEQDSQSYFPFSNQEEMLSFFGEKKADMPKNYFIPYDFFDRFTDNFDYYNPYSSFNIAQKYYKAYQKNKSNINLLFHTVNYLNTALESSAHCIQSPVRSVFRFLRHILKDPVWNQYPNAKKRITRLFYEEKNNQNRLYISAMKEQRRLLNQPIKTQKPFAIKAKEMLERE